MKKIFAIALALICAVGMIIPASAAELTAEEKNEKDALWSAFLEAVAPVEAGEGDYALVYRSADQTASTYAKYYAKSTGRDGEIFINMESFERWLWRATYIDPMMKTTAGDYDMYFGTLENYWCYSVNNALHALETYGTPEMVDAYKALMEWNYNYFVSHGAFYCFMEDKTSTEIKYGETDTPAEPEPSAEPAPSEPITSEEVEEIIGALEGEGLTEGDIEEILGELEDEGIIPPVEEEEGVWDGTMRLIKKNAVTIVVLIVLAAATCGVVIWRKNSGE